MKRRSPSPAGSPRADEDVPYARGPNSAAGRRGRRRSAYEAPRAAADRGTRLGGAESKRRRRPRLPAPPSRVTLLAAAADVPAVGAFAAERVGEGLRADLEGRAQERHAVGAEVEAVHRDPHAVPAPVAGVERDEGAAAAVAKAPAGEDRALEPAPHRGVDHDAARADQEHAC